MKEILHENLMDPSKQDHVALCYFPRIYFSFFLSYSSGTLLLSYCSLSFISLCPREPYDTSCVCKLGTIPRLARSERCKANCTLITTKSVKNHRIQWYSIAIFFQRKVILQPISLVEDIKQHLCSLKLHRVFVVNIVPLANALQQFLFTPTLLENKLDEHLAFSSISLYLKVCGIAEI